MTSPQLKILHVTRAPVGGIFRHIVDLMRGQIERGHQVGIICDSTTGGERAQAVLDELAPHLALGVTRIAIPREPGPRDPFALARVARRIQKAAPDVLHGHGAKGGVFVRLTRAASDAIRVYTPHGGSLHYPPNTLAGAVYGTLERLLMGRTDLFLFESAFARDRFTDTVGSPGGLVRVVRNGVGDAEFAPVETDPSASEIAYVGEFRHIKGADVLIDAVRLLHDRGRPVHLSLAGDGEEYEALKAKVAGLALAPFVTFAGFQPARVGFALGRVLVVPSRGDSLPYVVIEAAAAGVPIIATRVGGIPEIFGPEAGRLVPPANPLALAEAIAGMLDNPRMATASAARMQAHVRQGFSQAAMVEGVLGAYAVALSRRRGEPKEAISNPH